MLYSIHLSKLLSFFSFLFLFGNITFAFPYNARYLGLEEGLSNNMVTSIYRDHYGFMWIGTYNGLNRYDGVSFNIFQRTWGLDNTLPDNHITALTEDKENRVWIGTNKGLACYNYNDGNIYKAYYQPLIGAVHQIIDCKINALVTDFSGVLYVGTPRGFFLHKKGDNLFHQIQIQGVNNPNVQTLAIDQKGRVWVFVHEHGLGLYDVKTGRVRFVNDQLKAMTCMVADRSGKFLWMGSESGVFSFNMQSNHIQDLNAIYQLNNKSVMQIHQGNDQQLWIATDGGGVNLFERPNQKARVIGPGKSNGKLTSASVHVIFEDPKKSIWLGTIRGGVNILDSRGDLPIQTISHDPDNSNSLINDFTRSFCEDSYDNLWIGTSGGGVSYWNPRTNSFHNFIHQRNNLHSLSSDFIFSIIEDHDRNIWLATLNGGINRYDRKRNTFLHYDCYNDLTKNVDPSIWKLYETDNGEIWAAATRGGGLYRYHAESDKFHLYDPTLTDVSAMYKDRHGVFWVANGNLIQVDLLNKKHRSIPISSTVHAIYEDSKMRFWIGTAGGGLLLVNRSNGKMKRYTKEQGLPDNTVLSILEDNQGKLWISTFNGLCNFDPSSGKFLRFFASDGLQSNQFNVNAALKLRSGELLFGGLNGFNKFYPENVKTIVDTPKVYLTDFRINNVSIQKDSTFTGSKNVVNMNKIVLEYTQASIAVDYVAPASPFAHKVNYAYYLQGWDQHWNLVGNLRTAYYSRLSEGKYLLQIKSMDINGGFSGKELTIEIVILPPWYRTWWAFLFYLAVLISVPSVYMVYRSRQIQMKHIMELTKIKAEQEHLLNEKKLSFFTSISHEFKTPLTLIINPIKDLLSANPRDKNSELNIVYRNAKRLLGLVDHLLLFRKAESDSGGLVATKIDFALLARDVFDCFISQVKSKQIDYEFDNNELISSIFADVEKIEIVLFNLLSNAITFTPAGGKILVKISQDENMVYLAVEDSGPGIPAEVGERLFEKYYQVKDLSKSRMGFGIGLYLVKTFLDLHQGSIHYYNNSMGGATFKLGLLKGINHFKTGELHLDSGMSESYRHNFYQDGFPDEQKTSLEAESTPAQLDILISDRQSMLIIDDNADMRTYITSIFSENYKIYEAENGELGLHAIRKYLPDIIISDINMDELNGFDLCRILKADAAISHIPVILITGEASPEIELQGFETGAVDFVAKPFERSLLVARVNNILRNKADLQHYFYNKITLKNSVYNLAEDDRNFIYKCIDIIEQNLLERDFDVQKVADQMAMSYSSLYKRLRLITGRSVNSFIRFVRVRKAAEILINTNCNVNEAAMHVGFNDIKYFREHFVKIYGVNPSEFIKRHRTAFKKKYLIENVITYKGDV